MARAYGPNLGVNVVEGRTPHVVDLPFSKATANFGTTTRTTYNKNGLVEHSYSGGSDLYLTAPIVVIEDAQGGLPRALDGIHTGGHSTRLGFLYADRVATADRLTLFSVPVVSADEYTEYSFIAWTMGAKSNITSTASEQGTIDTAIQVELPPYAESSVFVLNYVEIVDGGQLTLWTQTDQQCVIANAPIIDSTEVATFIAINRTGSCAATYFLRSDDRAKFTYVEGEYYPDGWFDEPGDRYVVPVRPTINVYRELGAEAVIEQYPASDVPLIDVGFFPDLPNRAVGGQAGSTVDSADVEHFFPAFSCYVGWEHAHHHSRFVQYMKHVAGDVFIFPYFLSRLSYTQALALWKGAEKTLVSIDPDVYEDRFLQSLFPLNCLGNSEETCSTNGAVMWDVQLGFTKDNFATIQTVTDYSGVTFTPITVDDTATHSHLGVRKYVNDNAYILPHKFDSDAMFPTCLLFKITSPHTAPLVEDGTEFLLVSSAPMAPPDLTANKFKFPVYRVNLTAGSVVEGYVFEFDSPVGIIAMHRLYNNIILHVADTATTNHVFYLSTDEGVSWTAHVFTQLLKGYTGVSTVGLADDIPALLLPVYDVESETYRVAFLRVTESGELDLSEGWSIAGKIYTRDEDDPVPAADNLFLRLVVPVHQAHRQEDWLFREKEPFKKATVIE